MRVPESLSGNLPGVILCSVVAVAARALGTHYGAPVMLLALLLGMSLNFLSAEAKTAAGVEFTARALLRVGVALLGLRITASQVAALGWMPVLMVLVSVGSTIVVGMLLARAMGFRLQFGLLTGGAVAICGASAALALSAALPAHPLKERATLFTVISVSVLSTLAMMLYPMLTQALAMTELQAGLFIGGTIHDVAQVVGAGYSLSQTTGDAATLIKLMRVAMLLPLIVLAISFARLHERGQQRDTTVGSVSPPLPWFAFAFAALILLNSVGWLPERLVLSGQDVSQFLLVASMVAIGMKTQLRDVMTVGWKPFTLVLLETLFLALFFATWLNLVAS